MLLVDEDLSNTQFYARMLVLLPTTRQCLSDLYHHHPIVDYETVKCNNNINQINLWRSLKKL